MGINLWESFTGGIAAAIFLTVILSGLYDLHGLTEKAWEAYRLRQGLRQAAACLENAPYGLDYSGCVPGSQSGLVNVGVEFYRPETGSFSPDGPDEGLQRLRVRLTGKGGVLEVELLKSSF